MDCATFRGAIRADPLVKADAPDWQVFAFILYRDESFYPITSSNFGAPEFPPSVAFD
jgi:hypothetical protein